MRARAGSGWQTVLADLALILFMVTASVVASQKPDTAAAAVPEVPTRGEPFAIYRPGRGSPPLGVWLAEQGADPRQLLTIVVPYASGGQAAAVEQAAGLARQATVPARIVIEPGNPGDAYAALAFDKSAMPPEQLAR